MCSECVQSVFRVCSECVQGVFRMCSECVRNMFSVCSECFGICLECVQSVFRVFSECLQRVLRVSSECHQSVIRVSSECVQSVFNIEVISSPSASSVSIFGIFCFKHCLPRFSWLLAEEQQNGDHFLLFLNILYMEVDLYWLLHRSPFPSIFSLYGNSDGWFEYVLFFKYLSIV